MSNFQYDEEPVRVTRDSGYSKTELLSSENIRKSQERIENPNIVTGKYKLKELFADLGIVVIPERMTNWYAFTD